MRQGKGRLRGRLSQALLLGGLAVWPGPAGAAAETDASIAVPPAADPRIYDIVQDVSAERIEADVRQLVGFGTRNTLSETESSTRGIGAARRWIKAEFERISAACGGCLDVQFVADTVGGPDTRLGRMVEVVNVVAVLKGTREPGRYVIMSGDIDSRATVGNDATTDAPGANDNASGMAGTIEAARVLSRYRFDKSIAFLGLSGEEQGLFGGGIVARWARERGWIIEGVLNDDMIGNIAGIDGVVSNSSFRVFSQPRPVSDGEQQWRALRRYGGEVDGPSRQLARYVDRITDTYMTNLRAMMIYRLDRFGRGGHHTPFNDEGFPAVRIMETHENYNRQHQDVRVENGIAYGDVIEGVDFDYASKLTGVNAAVLASLAWAPAPPASVRIGGTVSPSTRLEWDSVGSPNLAGYKLYWRATTAPQWEHSRYVGKTTAYTLENIVIDNYLFGVAAVAESGDESTVVFPGGLLPRP